MNGELADILGKIHRAGFYRRFFDKSGIGYITEETA
jgi:hypothetical protein